jgi:predicted transcriptional regulator
LAGVSDKITIVPFVDSIPKINIMQIIIVIIISAKAQRAAILTLRLDFREIARKIIPARIITPSGITINIFDTSEN